jgi:exonuclease VII small subunit
MSSWEKVLEEHQQQEMFRKRCYQRLQQRKREIEEARDAHEKLRNHHMPTFREE